MRLRTTSGLLFVMSALLIVSATAQARTGFESADRRVKCVFGLYGHRTREVRCSSGVIRQLEENDDQPEYEPCVPGGENETQEDGPGAVQLLTWGRPYVLLGCHLETKRFRVLRPGESEVDGTLSCYALTGTAIYCRSRHSGSHFTISANRLTRLPTSRPSNG